MSTPTGTGTGSTRRPGRWTLPAGWRLSYCPQIVGAQLQHITYSSWLPRVMGAGALASLGPYPGYSPATDPTISNVFATAALRFGHSMISPRMRRLDQNLSSIPEGDLHLHQVCSHLLPEFQKLLQLKEASGPGPIQKYGLTNLPIYQSTIVELNLLNFIFLALTSYNIFKPLPCITLTLIRTFWLVGSLAG